MESTSYLAGRPSPSSANLFRASGAAHSALPHSLLHLPPLCSATKGARSCVNMASGFTPPSDDRSRTTRGSDDSAPARGSTDLVPAVSVIRTMTQSRPRAHAKAQAGSDGTSSPSPQQGVSLSAQQATLLAGASIQRAHQASEMASAAASSALQGHQAVVLAQARQRFVESEAHQVVDQVMSEARSFGHHAVTETQAESQEQTRMLKTQVNNFRLRRVNSHHALKG